MKADRETAAVLRMLDGFRRKPLRRRRVRLSRAYLRAVARAEALACRERDKTWVRDAVRRARALRAAIRSGR